ncbi:MAG: hypothetical protein A4E73_00115 [Syntrophaceae bacterium PtaU1.Bin231]|nr:MAG: hypothetical protein A4E73_00115 [Syntrophaceae bacterium PtaU1.Bin231]
MKKICLVTLLPVALLVLASFGYPAPAMTASPVLPVEPPAGPATPCKGIPEPRKACPQTPYINCMPPVPEKNRSMCSREYLEWLKEHCPGVKVVY